MRSRKITKLLRNLGLVFSSRFPFISYPMLKPTAQRQTTAPKMQETEPDVNCHGTLRNVSHDPPLDRPGYSQAHGIAGPAPPHDCRHQTLSLTSSTYLPINQI